MQQLNEVIAKNIYTNEAPISIDLRTTDVKKKDFEKIAEILSDKLTTLKSELQNHNGSPWKSNFIKKCQSKFSELSSIWNDSWIKHASGKRLIDDLYEEYTIRIPKLTLKRKLAKRIYTE